jgi:CheY-like chemotaxis protein
MSRNLLGEACDVLAEAVELEVALDAVARLTVPTLADFCAIDTLSPDGAALERVAVARNGGAPPTRDVEAWFPPDPAGDHPIARALRARRPELVQHVAAALDVDPARPRGREATPHSYLVLPLMARGQRFGVLSFASWRPDREGGIDHLTLARRLARQLALALDNRQLRGELGALLSSLSHELRTPLTATLGWVNLLRQGNLPSSLMGHGLDVLERSARGQARLLDEMLELARLRSGLGPFERRPVDIERVVEDSLSSTAGDTQARRVRTRAILDARGARVMGDAARLRRLVGGALSMAIAETPAGGEIAVLLSRPTDAAVCLTVRGGGRATRPAGGRAGEDDPAGPPRPGGLGVALARGLAELHGGRLGLDRNGEGFTLRIELSARAAQPAEESRGPRADGPGAAPSVLRGVRVLVVEDDADTREFLRLSLEGRGAVVRAAASAPEALGLLDRGPADVVLSDLSLPGRDGYGLLQAIRARGLRSLPAIALSALDDPAERARSAAAGFAEHLAKPVEPEQLVRCLARVAAEPRVA